MRRIEEGPRLTHNGALTIALALAPGDGWRIVIAIAPNHAIPKGEIVSADFAPGDVAQIIDALQAAVSDARRELT